MLSVDWAGRVGAGVSMAGVSVEAVMLISTTLALGRPLCLCQ